MRWLAVVPALVGLQLLATESGAAAVPPQAPAPSVAPAPASPTPPAHDTETQPSVPPPPPPGGPPPQYYVEPQATDSSAAPGAFGPQSAYEPPPPSPPIYEPMPPPPAETNSRAPRSALWLGARVGWLVPFGSLWLDGFGGGSGPAFRRRTFAGYASSGPIGEIDVGARLARRYMVFALFEHGSLGSGNLDDKSFGDQNRGATNLYGVGLRFSTDPGAVGFAMEVALGYRDFHAYWSDGTELAMTNGFLDARLGIGADIRVNRWFSLSPMAVLGGGSFGSARWSGPGGSHDAQTSLDQTGEYGTFAIQLGGHFDVY